MEIMIDDLYQDMSRKLLLLTLIHSYKHYNNLLALFSMFTHVAEYKGSVPTLLYSGCMPLRQDPILNK